MSAEPASSREAQDGWLDGYAGRPFDLTQTSRDYRASYRKGEKSKARDVANRPNLDAAIAEVRARNPRIVP